jgi:nucleoside-diphosphate-sugar epimerase
VLDRAVGGVDLIYHLAAAQTRVGAGKAVYWRTNVEGTQHLIDAVLRHRVARLVHCSTAGVTGSATNGPMSEETPYRPDPWNLYTTTKTEGEKLVRRAIADRGLPAVIFRPPVIYGPGDRKLLKLFRALAQRRFVMLGSGQTSYHMIYIDDLIDGILLCGTHPKAVGQAFILAGAECTTLLQVVTLVAQTLGVPPPRWHLPVGPVFAAGYLCELACRPFRIEPPLHRRRVEFFITSRAFDISKARRLLGYDPRVDLVTGIWRTAQWYRDHGHLGMSGAMPSAPRGE